MSWIILGVYEHLKDQHIYFVDSVSDETSVLIPFDYYEPNLVISNLDLPDEIKQDNFIIVPQDDDKNPIWIDATVDSLFKNNWVKVKK